MKNLQGIFTFLLGFSFIQPIFAQQYNTSFLDLVDHNVCEWPEIYNSDHTASSYAQLSIAIDSYFFSKANINPFDLAWFLYDREDKKEFYKIVFSYPCDTQNNTVLHRILQKPVLTETDINFVRALVTRSVALLNSTINIIEQTPISLLREKHPEILEDLRRFISIPENIGARYNSEVVADCDICI